MEGLAYKTRKRKEYDSISDKYYMLEPDEKISHREEILKNDGYGNRYYEPIVRIINTKTNRIIWSDEQQGYEQEMTEVNYHGHKIKVPSGDIIKTPINLNNYPNTGVAGELSFIESLQKEVNEWLCLI